MIYGYLRVSSDKQDVESQKQGVDGFAAARGWTIDQYISDEGVSGGKDPSKRKLGPLLKRLKKDDIVIAAEISRLGRDLYMVMEILHFCMKRGCKIYTVKDGFTLDDNIQSKVLAFAFGLAAEIERQMIRQRTREGLRLRIKLGVLVGRPPRAKSAPDKRKLAGKREIVERLMNSGLSRSKIAKKLKVDRNTLTRQLCYWGIHPMGLSYEKEFERARSYARSKRKPCYKDTPYEIVELPHEETLQYIRDGETIPEIHRHFPQFTYEQVYDTILSTEQLNIEYRRHAQKKLLSERSLKRQERQNLP